MSPTRSNSAPSAPTSTMPMKATAASPGTLVIARTPTQSAGSSCRRWYSSVRI